MRLSIDKVLFDFGLQLPRFLVELRLLRTFLALIACVTYSRALRWMGRCELVAMACRISEQKF